VSNIHDQAMHHIYQQVLDRVLGHMSQVQRASLQLLVQRLLVAAGGPEYIGTFRLLVLLGADCHSARLLAVLRAAQLSIAQRAPVTFQLQVVAVCLPAASNALLEQHERVFSTLFLHDDPRVQLQMLEAGQVVSFSRRPYLALEPWALARDALLVFGHLVMRGPKHFWAVACTWNWVQRCVWRLTASRQSMQWSPPCLRDSACVTWRGPAGVCARPVTGGGRTCISAWRRLPSG
jgi:hypothetical protein